MKYKIKRVKGGLDPYENPTWKFIYGDYGEVFHIEQILYDALTPKEVDAIVEEHYENFVKKVEGQI